jgi:hypothetical protein
MVKRHSLFLITFHQGGEELTVFACHESEVGKLRYRELLSLAYPLLFQGDNALEDS